MEGSKLGLLTRAVESLKWPIDLFFEKLFSRRLPRDLQHVHRAANWQHGRDKVASALGIDRVSDLFAGPLERCDALVKKTEDISREIITTESLLSNVGGVVTELLSLPAEIMLALRTVHRLGACYGYELDDPGDETLVLAIIGMSLLDQPEERLRARRLIRELEEGSCPREDEDRLATIADTKLEDEVGDGLVKEIGATLVEEKLGEGIPLLGAAVGVVLDNAFLSGVEEAARFTFQERWLRDHGKLDEIAPAPAAEDPSESLGARLSQAVYSTSYAVGFGVAFPAALLARGGATVLPESACDGLADGARSASDDADRLIAGVRGRPGPALGPAS